jgi:xanthine dehydrogenase molybdopterin-binding subunit B
VRVLGVLFVRSSKKVKERVEFGILKIERRARLGKLNKKKKEREKHQAYFANKINIYEDEKLLRNSQMKKGEIHLKIQANTHTQIYEMRIGGKEKVKEKEKSKRQESQ